MIRDDEYPRDRLPPWVNYTVPIIVAIFALIGLYDLLLVRL